ncbi:lamin tail domain-containing protein [Winogradskyella maritima]|uniref:Lamin tail domain-containing protein n=1 Tax=Winogradskyella maritima TaxID=1517766 RepID=A0ABV8AD61_9FLAO|nr:lamin tail domain-containing protein [Winogradskyella maritima]
MTKKYALLIALISGAIYFSFSQTTIAIQDFDGTAPEWSFTNDVTFFDNGADGFYGIHDDNNLLTDGTPNDTGTGNPADINAIDFTNILSDFLFVNDLEDEGVNGTTGNATVTFSPVTVSGYNTISLSFDYDIVGFERSADEINYQVYLDGVGQGLVRMVPFANSGAYTNEGTASITIPDGTTTIYLELIVKQNGDADQAGFDNFKVTGIPSCAPSHTISTFSPSEGPVNTLVTITGTGFTAGSMATLNGTTATIVSQTATELQILIPAGASSGILTITENGCDLASSNSFTIIGSKNASCSGSVSTNELFISEITDATAGSLSYIEIYNSTGATVDLSDYTIQLRYNAGGTTNIISPSGNLPDGGIYVASTTIDTQCAGIVGADASLSNVTSGIGGINTAKNDSDCVSLYKNYVSSANPGTLIDVWGDCADKNWRENLGVAIGNEGFDFRRLTNSSPPSVNFTPSDWDIIDWDDDACTDDDYSDIGFFTPGLAPSITGFSTAGSGCSGARTITVLATEGFDDAADTKDLVYQWYVVAPGASNWTALTDVTPYSGVTTSVLTISDISGFNGYQYYCQVMEDDADCFVATDATFISTETATWDGTTWNWSDGTASGTIPTLSNAVVMDGNYNTSTNGSFEACSLIIDSGTLNIANGNYVNVVNDVTIYGGRLTVQTKGALIQQGVGIDAGSFTLSGGNSNVNKRTARLQNYYDYTYWGSPITNGTVGTSLFSTNPNRRYWFDASNFIDSNNDGIDDNGDAWTLADASLALTPGMGVATTHDQNFFTPNTAYTYNFEGPLNTGDISYSVVYNTANDNTLHWNLLGNPYPSALDVDTFFTTNINTLGRAVYMWSHVSPPLGSNPGNEVLNFNQNDYVTINHAGEAGNGADTDGDGDIDGDDTPVRQIPSGQGFFMATITSGSVNFTNDMRVSGENSNNQFYRNTNNLTNQSPYKEKLWLNLSSEIGIYSQICLVYMDEATAGFDGNSYDTTRNYAGNAGMLYSLIDDQGETPFVIQAKSLSDLNEDEVVKIGFGAYVSTIETYTIDLLKFEGNFVSNNTVFLKDNLLGILHDLTASKYEFESEGGQFSDRFELVFKQNSTLSSDEFELEANALKIIELEHGEVQFLLTNKNLSIQAVSIYDLQGRLIYDLEGSSNSETYDFSALSTSSYIANVRLSNGQIISQKAIKQF